MGLLSRIYQKVIVAVDLDLKICKLIVSYPNNKAMQKEERYFKTINGDLPIEAAKYIRKIKNKFPYTYIATMSRVGGQGLLNGSKMSVFEKFDLVPKQLTIMLINNAWFIYINKNDLHKYQNKFSKIFGVDLVFSPFVLMYEKVKEHLESVRKLYVLQGKHASVLMIADNKNMYYGKYVAFDEDIFIDETKDSTDSVSTESIMSQNHMNDFDEISDIDENIIIKDYDNRNIDMMSIQATGLNELVAANHIVEIIQNALDEFYNDDRYAGDFIDELFILDSYGMSENTITHLRNNILLDMQFIQIDICEEISNLAKSELKL